MGLIGLIGKFKVFECLTLVGGWKVFETYLVNLINTFLINLEGLETRVSVLWVFAL